MNQTERRERETERWDVIEGVKTDDAGSIKHRGEKPTASLITGGGNEFVTLSETQVTTCVSSPSLSEHRNPPSSQAGACQ